MHLNALPISAAADRRRFGRTTFVLMALSAFAASAAAAKVDCAGLGGQTIGGA